MGNPSAIRQQADGETLEPFIQLWFAGNHSDIGGSYPEAESRLSDISLQWMVEQAIEIPHPLKLNHRKLHLHPAADGLQHCELASTRDMLEAVVPRWLKWLTPKGYAVQAREMMPYFLVHPSVGERFALPSVPQCGGSGPYRPEALRGHDKFKAGYSAAAGAA